MSRAHDFAIVGMGVTEQGSLPGRSGSDLRAETLMAALADAGLKTTDTDEYIYQHGIIGGYGDGGELAKRLGMNPNFVWNLEAGGTSAIAATIIACATTASGQAK